MRKTFSSLSVLLLLCALSASSFAGERPPGIGRIHLGDPAADDQVESRGREIFDGELVKTVDDWAVIHLDNGQVLRVTSNAALAIESRPASTVSVRLLAGRVSLIGEGQVRTVGAPSQFVLRAAELDVATAEALLLESAAAAGRAGGAARARAIRSR